jgi:sugar porter (SP) family MFS transporter
MITCGIVVSYLVDLALTLGENEWRWMFGIGAMPAVILLLGMITLSESPRWLISHGRSDEAREILKKIMPENKIAGEIDSIQKSLAIKQGSWKEVMAPWIRPALIVGVALAFFQQVTGINTIIYYAPTIFEFAGFGSHKVSILATVGVGTVNVLMTVVAIRFLDRLGRKPLLYIGLVGMTLSLGILGLAFYLPGMADSLKLLTVLSVLFYIASFAISLGPIFWLIIAEIYPLKVRGRAMSLATLSNWLFNMLVASTFLTLTERLGKAGAFWFYAAVCLIALVFCYLYVPETKGKTLEGIENALKKNEGLRAFGRM